MRVPRSPACANRTSEEWRRIRQYQAAGTFRSSSSSHTTAFPSDGARQSPRGDNAPPAETLGPFGSAERLNWLKAKNRRKNTCSQWRISARVN